MNFTKMNGIGNDYIFINGTERKINIEKNEIKLLCNRNFGIGGDGLIIVEKSNISDFKMVIFNSDGSKAEMCGNALRCLIKFVLIERLTDKTNLKIQTDAGIRSVWLNSDGTVSANMSKPICIKVPIEYKADKDMNISGYKVNAGNPHFIVFSHDFQNLFEKYAKKISENFSVFPYGTNVEFAEIYPQDNLIKMRVYERGSGETLACGTGATSVFEIAFLLGKIKEKAKIILKGGEILCSHNDKGEVIITGKADINFEGKTKIIKGL